MKLRIKKALYRAAKAYQIETDDRSDSEIALDLANIFLQEFTSQEELLKNS